MGSFISQVSHPMRDADADAVVAGLAGGKEAL